MTVLLLCFLLLVLQLPYSVAYLLFTLTLPAQKAHCARTHISIITMSWSFYTTLDTGTRGVTRTSSWQLTCYNDSMNFCSYFCHALIYVHITYERKSVIIFFVLLIFNLQIYIITGQLIVLNITMRFIIL